MAKKRKRIDYDSPLMNIYSPEYQYLMKQNAPENANVAGLGDWFSNLFRRNKQQPDYHRDTVSMGLGTENSLQGVGNGGTDWNNRDFSLTGQSNQQQFNYNPNQELTTSQQYQNTLKDPENLAPKQTGEQSKQPSAGSNVNWGGIIGTAATATANAISNGGSAADIVANAMGIPVLAKMWKANTEKGDANIKSAQETIASVQDNKYIQDANSLQGVGNALKLNMSNKPKMIDTSGFQRMTNWKDFSSGRGSGTWWKNMATAQFQGAAAGSVGGPWGALGGATAGLLGSIGGLFGGKKRAKRAMNEYNQRMDSLRAYATAENLRRKADYELSNQNAIHNGLGQQSIKEMSNFRAFGGNLYPDGGSIDPYYPESQDPTAVNWLSDWYRQRPEQMKNTFKPTRYNDYSFTLPKPNISGEYESIEDIPSNRSVDWETRKYNDINEYNNTLYHNLIDRAASPSILYRMDLPSDIKGVYSASGLYEKEKELPIEDINKSTKIIEFIDNFKATNNNQSPKLEDYEAAGLNPLDLMGVFTNQIETGKLPKVANTISYNMREVPAYANPEEDYYDAETLSNRIHETNHAIQNDNRGISRSLSNIVNMNKQIAEGVVPNSYLDSPEEIHSRMMQLRYETGLKPTDIITQDFINNNKDKIKALNLDRYTDQSLINLLNNVVDNNNVDNYNNIAAMGGNLYTDLSPNMMNLWNDKQNIDKQKLMNQQMNFGLGNSFNTKLNTFDYGGSMNGMDLPTNMQYYENGGSHEENPNGGIQVGQDQQGNPNLVEQGEFRYGDYIFSDRIPVDYSILSDFNVEKGKSNRNTKNNPTYAELAKKTADKYKDLNDKISKDSLNKQLDRLQQSQEAQKFKEQQDQQYAYYTNALKSPTQGNPMYGNMKYNGMGNANQGVNTGVDEGMSNAMDNSDLSNVNRSGNPMMVAYGGNIYKDGDEMSFIIPKSLLGSVRTPSLSYSTPTLNNFSSFVDVNSDKNINDNQSYEYLNNYFTPNQVADLRESYGLSRAGGIDTPFVKNVQKMIGVRRNGNFDDKSQLALNKFANYPTEDVVNPNNSQYGTTQGNSFGTSTSTKVATKTPTQVTLRDENTSDENIKTINGNESSVNNTMAVSGKGPQEPVEVDYNLGRPAAGISDYTDPTVPMYNDNGYWANLAKGIMPNLMNWSGQANWEFDPDWKPEIKLESLGKTAYRDRIADHLGDYIAPNLMDIERLNNAAMAQTAANARGVSNIGGGNRGFVSSQMAANDYNGQMGIGNNYVTANQYNTDQLFKSAEFNKATNQFNAIANNEAWRDNLNSWLQGKNMEINALVQANQARNQKAEYKDRVDRDAALNRSSDLGAMADNMINTVVDNALYNRGLNNINTKLNNRYYFNKDKGWTYKGDTGIGRQINEYAKGVRLTSDDYTQINNILKEDPHNIAGIEGIIDARRAEQDKQDIKDFNDKHNSIIADFDNYSNLVDDALFSDIYKNEDRLAFNKARDKYEEVINNKKSTSSQKEQAYNDFRNKVNQMKNKYALYKGMVYSQRNKSFDLTPEEYAVEYEKKQKDNKNAYGGKINTRKHREHSYMDI